MYKQEISPIVEMTEGRMVDAYRNDGKRLLKRRSDQRLRGNELELEMKKNSLR